MTVAGHTYIFEPSRWDLRGIFSDPSGREIPVEGSSLILHSDHLWFLEGRLRILYDPPLETIHSCTILPFPAGATETTWTSHHPELGRQAGRFVVVENTILSLFRSTDTSYHGSDWLRQMDAQTYEGRGILLAGDRLVSAWAVNLRRQE